MKSENSIVERMKQEQRIMYKIANPFPKSLIASQQAGIQGVALAFDRNSKSLEFTSTVESFQSSWQRSSISSETQAALDYAHNVSNIGATLGVVANSPLAELYNSRRKIFSDIAQVQQGVAFSMQSTLKALHSDTMKHLISSIGSLDTTFTAVRSIDFSGIGALDIDKLMNAEEIQEGNFDLAGSITVTRPEKKLVDLTESELDALIKKHTSKIGTFSIAAFTCALFEDYVKEVALVVIEIIFAFILTLLMGQFNAGVIEEVGNRIEETDTYRDMRKVITRYVKINPTDQIAFLRKDSFLREGSSKSSPIVSEAKITKKTVLTILERKENWIRIEVNTGDDSGLVGWLQESTVVKFKRMDR